MSIYLINDALLREITGGAVVEIDKGLTDERDAISAGFTEKVIVPGGGPVSAIEISGLPLH